METAAAPVMNLEGKIKTVRILPFLLEINIYKKSGQLFYCPDFFAYKEDFLV